MWRHFARIQVLHSGGVILQSTSAPAFHKIELIFQCLLREQLFGLSLSVKILKYTKNCSGQDYLTAAFSQPALEQLTFF
jgi:hypothetical protein